MYLYIIKLNILPTFLQSSILFICMHLTTCLLIYIEQLITHITYLRSIQQGFLRNKINNDHSATNKASSHNRDPNKV